MPACTDLPPTADEAKPIGAIESGATALLRRLLASPWAALVAFVVIGLVVYSPALNGELIWDDEYLVGQNPFYKSPIFAIEVFRHYLFFDSFSIYYRPIQNISYMVDYWFWAGNPFGYHLTNVLLHALSGFLLYRVLRRILPGLLNLAADPRAVLVETTSFLVALVWTVHPIHNAGVAYISGRADSLASLFALSAWLLILRAPLALQRWKRIALFALAAVAMLTALCAKEIALMWLVLFLGHLFIFDRTRPMRVKLAMFAGLAILFGIYYGLHSLPPHRTPMAGNPTAPLPARLLLMLRALGDYTGLIFYPSRLLMDRTLTSPAMYANTASWYSMLRYEYLSVIGSLALVIGSVLCGKDTPARRLRVFGALWFIVAFLPISNLFPLNAEVAEHWIYLASIGYLSFLAGCVLMLAPRWRQILAGAVMLAAVAFGVRTAVRAADWSDPEHFYLRTIESGGGTPRIFGNLAAAYGKKRDYVKQEAVLRRTLAAFPDFTPARINLGICLGNQGRTAEAEVLLNFAKPAAAQMSTQFPRTWSAALNLAGLRAKAGHADESLSILAETRARFPETWDVVKYEAELLETTRGPAAALPSIEQFASTHWWHEDAWLTLGQLRAAVGDIDGGIAAMSAASRLDIYNAKPFANIARLEMGRNRAEAAVDAQQRAIRRDPNQPSRHLMLADMLKKLGRNEEAAAAFERAKEMRASIQPSGS